MLHTKKQRLWFVIASIWFIGWTLAYISSAAITPYGFKLGGWFMFAVLPIALIWISIVWIKKVRDWVGSGR